MSHFGFSSFSRSGPKNYPGSFLRRDPHPTNHGVPEYADSGGRLARAGARGSDSAGVYGIGDLVGGQLTCRSCYFRPFLLKIFFSTLSIKCDCNFCAHSSPQTCKAPSVSARSSLQGARYRTGARYCSIDVHMTHQRSLAPFNTPQFGPAHR
jgi:hypothetical protein